MSQKDKNRGFTIVEMMLAMGFVAALLVAIALTVIQIANIYNKGITIKSVNQAGTDLTADIQRTISSSMPFAIDPDGVDDVSDPNDDNTNYLVKTNPSGNIVGGVLCTGQYTYIWNTGWGIQKSASDTIKYSGTDSTKTIYFIKAYDPVSKYCRIKNIPIDKSGTTELLNSDNNNSQYLLAIHQFTAGSPILDSTTGQRLYNIQFTIGTSNADELTGAPNYECSVSGVNSNFNYCFVTRFDIIARAGNDR